ncbi:MAG: methyltransferase domain-containing protein [Solirubrobacteraceae bacterium]
MTDTTPEKRTRDVWAAGDYERIARRLTVAGESIVRHTAVAPGDRVLDVACGTGNATLPAARTGADVTGLDLTPELLARAALEAGDLDIDWIEGDAQALPFDDGSFDVVLSTFGAMFAPDQARTAAELARVLRPGGRLGMCNWAPDGATGDMFATVARHVPSPPGAPNPLAWGDATRVRELLEPHGLTLAVSREHVEFHLGTPAEAVAEYSTYFGPILKAREQLEPQGAWTALAADLEAFYERWSLAAPGEVVYRAEYLVVEGTRAETGAAGHR